mmetsp:Transcript_8992/g.24920  ORF Transcript_8992/g.24920 Transcript_8992/m.24920 type:complete len:289 (+) Transcript_8992:101-967(+)
MLEKYSTEVGLCFSFLNNGGHWPLKVVVLVQKRRTLWVGCWVRCRWFVRTRMLPLRLQVRVRNPKINHIHETWEQDHDKQQLHSNVSLERLKQNLSHNGQSIRKHPHKQVHDEFDKGQNSHPCKELTDPVLPSIRSHINAGVFEVSPVPFFGPVVQYPQADNGQKQAECCVDQVAYAVPCALILQFDVPPHIHGEYSCNHHIQNVCIAGPQSLLKDIHEPRPKQSPRHFLQSFNPKRPQSQKGEKDLHQDGKEIILIINLAPLDFFLVEEIVGFVSHGRGCLCVYCDV